MPASAFIVTAMVMSAICYSANPADILYLGDPTTAIVECVVRTEQVSYRTGIPKATLNDCSFAPTPDFCGYYQVQLYDYK